MAFEPSATCSLIGTSTLLFTDTSNGADATITERRIYLQKYDGTYIVPEGTTTDYIVWDINDTTITLENILNRSYTLNMTVVWVVPSPATNYEYEILQIFDAYAYVFGGLLLSQRLARSPLYSQITQFNPNEANLLVNILQAENAVTILQNIGLSQGALDVTYYMENNTQFLFN